MKTTPLALVFGLPKKRRDVESDPYLALRPDLDRFWLEFFRGDSPNCVVGGALIVATAASVFAQGYRVGGYLGGVSNVDRYF
jgi:hypothetical protein